MSYSSLSRESNFAVGRPIRGGIPVIFPQFGGGVLPQHGFARTSDWQLVRTELGEDGMVAADFLLTDSPETRALWPHPFRLELGVRLDEQALAITLAVRNTGTEHFDFHAALHTYFAVADVRQCAVYGLAGVSYIDSLREDIREVEMRTALRFDRETDRIYLQAPHELRLVDAAPQPHHAHQQSGHARRGGVEPVDRKIAAHARLRRRRIPAHGLRGNRQYGRHTPPTRRRGMAGGDGVALLSTRRADN